MATGHGFLALGLQDKGIDQDEIVSGVSAKYTTCTCVHTFVCVSFGGRESTKPYFAAQSLILRCVKINQVYMQLLLVNQYIVKSNKSL